MIYIHIFFSQGQEERTLAWLCRRARTLIQIAWQVSLNNISVFQVWGVPAQKVVFWETVWFGRLWGSDSCFKDNYWPVKWERSGLCYHGNASQVKLSLKRVKLSRECMPNFNLPFSQNILSCILPVIHFYDFALCLVPKAHFFQMLIGHRVTIKRYTK